MTMRIKTLVKSSVCLPEVIDKGDWIDLSAQWETSFKAPYAKCLHKKRNAETEATDRFREVLFDYKVIPLGVAVQLPDGFEAVIAPRSSLFKKTGLLQANSVGVIDNSYSGDNDVWGFPAVATRAITVPEGTRICQFRIQLSQKATFWQKLKWLFSSKIRIEQVSSLGNPDRKGFGEGTGK